MRRSVAAWRLLALGALFSAIVGCARLPDTDPSPSFAVTATEETPLGRAVAALTAEQPDRSGVHLLGNPRRAFATLLGLADAAERSLDLQYYAWHTDTTGWLLIHAVWAAAERGVRVRLLLDDLNTAGKDWVLAALDAHPGIEVRLFNPFPNRQLRFLDVARDFLGSNRRMHNKAFIADNQATVLGGRNIGDSYHGEGAKVTFADLDVLAIGPIVREVSVQFDRFWNSHFAVQASAVIRPQQPPPDDYLATRTAVRLAGGPSLDYVATLDVAVRADPLDVLPLHWGRAQLIYDPPEKIAAGRYASDERMIPELMARMGVPERRLDIVTPYFVVSEAWTDVFVAWAKGGVQLRILTNSLAANDPGIAHAGYVVRRRDLVRGGVELFELKASAVDPHLGDAEQGFASSAATLHAKAGAIDGKRLFVGSLNLDQRSAWLNTEMGIVIDNPDLAQALHRMFDERLDAHAYRLVIGPDGQLDWLEDTPDATVVHDSEPEAGLLRWLGSGIFTILPLDWLL